MSMNFVTFNQDYSHLAVATSRGFRIFTTNPFVKCSESKVGDVSLLEMLFSTSLVALITSPRRLQIINTKRQSTICELTFPTTVLAVRLNRMRLVVVLEDQIYLYDISNMKLLHTIETSPNPQAICALSSNENCYLAYPLPQRSAPNPQSPSHAPPGNSGIHVAPTTGDVLLFDANKMEAVNVVTAHRAPLACIALNSTGTLLATASDKGTIIRVFSVPGAEKLYQFRRGSMPSHIYSMSFNTTSSLLCVSSATDTIHIFKLGGAGRRSSFDGKRPGSASSGGGGLKGHTRNRSLSPDTAEGMSADGDSELGPDGLAPRKHNGTFLGMIRRTSQNVGSALAGSVGNYLPTSVAEMWEPSRDFAWCKIPKTAVGTSGSALGSTNQLRSVVAMSQSSPLVMVVTNEGHFYVYGIDLEKGGEGTLIKTYEVANDNERMGASVVEE